MMGSVQPLLLIGTGLLCLGELLHIVGLATPNWMLEKPEVVTFGLFKACKGTRCATFTEESLPSDLKAVQAMVILGMVSGLFGALAAIVILVSRIMSKSPSFIVLILAPAACVMSGICMIIGVIVYSTTFFKDIKDALPVTFSVEYGYSFYLCIVGAILMFPSGLLVMIGGRSPQ